MDDDQQDTHLRHRGCTSDSVGREEHNQKVEDVVENSSTSDVREIGGVAPSSSSQFQTASEYCQALRQSLWTYQYYQSMQWFQMNTMTAFYSMMNANMAPQIHQTGFTNPPPTTRPTPQAARTRNQEDGHSRNGMGGTEYRLASLPQRVIAETIDFFLLFTVKLTVTMVAIEQFGILDQPKFGFPLMHDFDGDLSVEDISELIIWAFFYRLNVCLFEALCLRKGIGRVGGATPGKRILGIKVVSCLYILDIAEDRIRVIPAQNIGFWNALVRSVIKNFSLTFFFPACFTALFFHHNRAAYDHIANCVVVRDIDRRR